MKKSAFTLIELLVVIVIIGILATISVAQFNKYQEKARYARALSFWSQSSKLMNAKMEARILYLNYENGTDPIDSPAVEINGSASAANNILITEPTFSSASTQAIFIENDGVRDSGAVYEAKQKTPKQTFTVSEWFYLPSDSFLYQSALVHSFTGIYPFGVSAVSGANFRYFFEDGTNYSQTVVPVEDLEFDRWQHVLASFDGLNVVIYLDGTKIYDEPLPVAHQGKTIGGFTKIKIVHLPGIGDKVYMDEINVWDEPFDQF